MKKRKSPFIKSISPVQLDNGSLQLQQITDYILTFINPEKIICFGSTITRTISKSCFVEEDNTEKIQPLNRYCLLVIPSVTEKTADILMQQTIEQNCKTMANLTVIVHRMKEVNQCLQQGSSFFTAIYKSGMLLHNLDQEPFVAAAPLIDQTQKISRRELFWNQWFQLASDFMLGAQFYTTQSKNNLAVFMLHQCLQHCYAGMLRVLTGYRTSSNSLRRLIKLIENALPESSFSTIHQNSPEENRLMAILLKGFSDARYNDDFAITQQEVIILIGRVGEILDGAHLICKERIETIKEDLKNQPNKPDAAQ